MNESRSKCGKVISLLAGCRRRLRDCVLLGLAAAAISGSALAQDEMPPDAAPPPVKFLSAEEKKLLDSEKKDVKDRTKLALKLMDARLKAAEAASESGKFDEMFEELGVFHGLMDNTLEFLTGSSEGSKKISGKVLSNFKRFEIGIRAFTPRLELIRRSSPSSHEYYVRTLLKQLRDARTRATEPFYGDSVLTVKKP